MTTIIERILARDTSLLRETSDQNKGLRESPFSELQRQIEEINFKENPMALFLLISAIQQVEFLEAIPWLLDNFFVFDTGYCDPEAYLFTFPIIPVEMLQFIVNSVPQRFALASVFDSLISLDSSEETYNACQRAVDVLGDTDFASWISFANEADFQDNAMVWVFCSQQARKVAPFAEKPKYLIVEEEDEMEPLLLMQQKVTIQEGESIQEFIVRRAGDKTLFRTLGPSNFQLGASDEDILDGFADHRMFTDERFTPEDQSSWFTGSCDQCWRRIADKRYATRKPLVGPGGWRDQFCSWRCAKLNCEDYEIAEREMIDYYEKQCFDIGIFDYVRGEQNTRDDVAPALLTLPTTS